MFFIAICPTNVFCPNDIFLFEQNMFLFRRIAFYRIVITINLRERERERERERKKERERERERIKCFDAWLIQRFFMNYIYDYAIID